LFAKKSARGNRERRSIPAAPKRRGERKKRKVRNWDPVLIPPPWAMDEERKEVR